MQVSFFARIGDLSLVESEKFRNCLGEETKKY